MKRCPQCYEPYGGDEKFCEADGHELLADPTFSPQIETVAAPPAAAKAVWWPAAALGILVGVVIGAGIFAAGSLMSTSEPHGTPTTSRVTETREVNPPPRTVVASNAAPTPEAAESPSPESTEEAAQAEPTATSAATPAAVHKTASVSLNQDPISTGEKRAKSESDSSVQTVIEMNDGSTLDVDAAWEDKQGIWYRRGGLVSFVDSSRVKAIAARRPTKATEVPNR
jgi:cytoskeletal protein RodZ